MKDCSKDVLAYHDAEVTLPQSERTKMRDRRNANRDRLRARLKESGDPAVEYFIKQGSYAMLTMVQDADNDYDIDDGVYFKQASLKKADGSDRTPSEVRTMVRLALRDDRFSRQPTDHGSCVRIHYNEGYHVDMPVYRIRTWDSQYELAKDDTWTVSRAADVEEWFDRENVRQSPDDTNGRQLRRITRDIKKFARSRGYWKPNIAAGFTITKLVTECFMGNAGREDDALRSTMRAIYNRLVLNLQVAHPVTPGAWLTKGADDPKTKYLREKLKEALDDLDVLDKVFCTREMALAAWDKVFNTKFFSGRLEKEAGGRLLKTATASAALEFPDRPVQPNQPAGFA